MQCSFPECQEESQPGKWGAVRAHSAGWFFSRDGVAAWCPAHLPGWVTAWRERQKQVR